MNREELIKVLENGLELLKNSESEMTVAKCLDTMGGICKYEASKIREDLVNKVESRLFKTRLDILED